MPRHSSTSQQRRLATGRAERRTGTVMLNFSHQTRVFLCSTPVDMRKSFRGLCQVAESSLQKDPACGHWFVFLNRRADRLKLLGWDGRGFWIWYMYISGRRRSGNLHSHRRAFTQVTQRDYSRNCLERSFHRRRDLDSTLREG